MISDNAIVFQAKIDYVRILIDNINFLGKDTEEFSLVVDELLKQVDDRIKEIISRGEVQVINGEKVARKMLIDGVYLEAINKIDKIISSLDNYLVYFQTMSNCTYVDKLENIDKLELEQIIDSLITCLKKIRGSETVYFKDEEKAVRMLYDTVYKVIKLEYRINNDKKSRLYDYVYDYKTDKIFISKLILEEIKKIKEDGIDASRLEHIVNKINRSSFSEDVYFNEELIKEIVNIYDNNKIKESILTLSKRYNDNIKSIEYSRELLDENNDCIDEVKNNRRTITKDISKAIISYILSLAILGSLAVAPFTKGKKVKTIRTKTNIETMASDEVEEKYLEYDENTNSVYIEVLEPYERIGNLESYGRNTYRYEIDYNLYGDKEIAEILELIDLDKILSYLEEVEPIYETKNGTLDYYDLYEETIYELVKIKQIPDDYIYKLDLYLACISLLIFAVLFSIDIAFTGIPFDDIYRQRFLILGTTSWLIDKRRNWTTEDKDKLKKLLRDKKELEKKIRYLLDTNEEIRNKYYEMMKDPRVKEMLNELTKDKSNVLIKDIDEKNKGRKRVLQK